MRSRWLGIIMAKFLKFFLCVCLHVWTEMKSRSVLPQEKKAKKKRPIFAILDEQAWSIKDLLYVNIDSSNNNKFVGKS